MRSNALALELAFQQPEQSITLDATASPAQLGALVCHSQAGRATNVADWDDRNVAEARELSSSWEASSHDFWDLLADLIEAWARSGERAAGFALGYWLTSVRLQGLSVAQVSQLTRFLADPVFLKHPQKTRSVRRYPTGGISEKQAILLPAVLRLLSEAAEVNSSFLIARRLGHTGGTSDKLRILPNFSVASAEQVSNWDGTAPTVRYFTAGSDFCPRDEVLYFLRGETGTVRQVGLIVASIIAKQYALQADATLLDVLYGPGAFFYSLSEAESFIALAAAVSAVLPLPVQFSLRPTSRIAWRSIGNATEIGEILTLLDCPTRSGVPARSELALSQAFATRLVENPTLPSHAIESKIEDGWLDGSLRENLLQLWSEHGVDERFTAAVRRSGAAAVLHGLDVTTVPAPRTGVLSSRDVVELADMVNNRLNTYTAGGGGLPASPNAGGIVLGAALGDIVERGKPLVRVYTAGEVDPQLVRDLTDNLEVSETAR